MQLNNTQIVKEIYKFYKINYSLKNKLQWM